METNSIKNNKKAFYEKLWFWLVVLIGMFIIAGITEGNKNVSICRK